MFCSNCGAQVKEGSRFCEVCGAQLIQPQQPMQTQMSQQQAQQPQYTQQPAQPQANQPQYTQQPAQPQANQPQQPIQPQAGQPQMSQPQAQAQKNGKSGKKNKDKQKKKNKGIIIALIIVSVIAVLAIAALIVILVSPARKMVKEIEAGEYAEAKEICDEKVIDSGFQVMLAEKLLDNYMDELDDDFMRDKVSFAKRFADLKGIDGLDIPEIEREMGEEYADLADDVIELYEDTVIDYDTACSYITEMNGVSTSPEFLEEFNKACTVLSLDLSAAPQTNPGTDTETTPNPDTETPAVNERDIYLEYVKNTLVPQYGLFSEETTYGVMLSPNDKWLTPKGIASAYFGDLDGDASEEMILFVFKEEPDEFDASSMIYYLYIQSYKLDESKTPYLTDETRTGTYVENFDNSYYLMPNEYLHPYFAVSVVYTDNQTYFFVEDVAHTLAFADGTSLNYWALKYENGQMVKAFEFNQTAGGSSDFAYTGYVFENDVPVSSTLLYADMPENYSETPAYSSFQEALTGFFAGYGINVEYFEWSDIDGADSILADSTRHEELFEIEISSDCDDYTTYMMDAEFDDESILHDALQNAGGTTGNTGNNAGSAQGASAMYTSYADIAQIYLNNYNTVKSTGDVNSVSEQEDINFLFSNDVMYDPDHPAFMLYDVNGDGVQEFFIALCYQADGSSYTIYDVYTYADGQCTKLMWNLGYRAGTCVFCENGIIKDMWSSGAFESGTNYWTLPAGGSALEKYDAVSYHVENIEHYYNSTDADPSKEITYDEFNNIQNKYVEIKVTSYELNDANLEQLRNGALAPNTRK